MELGSEYSLDLSELNTAEDNVFKYLAEYKSEYYDTGRSALKALLARLNMQEGTILLPEYTCESVIKCFPQDRISFYKIREDFTIDDGDLSGKLNENVRIFFLMHYFGTVQPYHISKKIQDAARRYDFIIIEDTTHSLLSCSAAIGDYMIASLRKWLPLPGLGILYTRQDTASLMNTKENYEASLDNERIKAMILKSMYLKGELDCNEEYRRIFKECEERIDNGREILKASRLSIFLAGCYSIEDIAYKRVHNYKRLLSRLAMHGYEPVNKCALDAEGDDVPFAYVIRCDNADTRDKLRSYLMEHRVYCAVHWPIDGIREDERAGHVHNADTLLTLPIDQRYGDKEMDYLADMILSFNADTNIPI